MLEQCELLRLRNIRRNRLLWRSTRHRLRLLPAVYVKPVADSRADARANASAGASAGASADASTNAGADARADAHADARADACADTASVRGR